MSPQRFAVFAVLCGTLVLNGWIAADLAGLGSREITNDEARIAVDIPRATAISRDRLDGLPVQGVIEAAFSALPFEVPEIESILAALPDPQVMRPVERIASAGAPDPAQNDGEASTLPAGKAEVASIESSLPDSHEAAPAGTPPAVFALASEPDPVQVEASARSIEATEIASVDAAVPDRRKMRLVSLFRPDSLEEEEDLKPAARVVETPNECLVPEICIDDYLWAFYERTPKVDSNKVLERIKTSIKKKGKTRTVIKTIKKYVIADFTWKDPIAAQKAGMSVKDYVIGGMDRGFKLKLYHALVAMENAGLMPGITSAFRDDYRQAIASGNKAASDSSYHGGSRRGGYGHGLAADLVSVKGETRLQRFASSVELWKWIDAHEKDLGIGRPYLDRDPPHVGPIDGKEYAAKRGGAKARLAQSIMSRRHPVAVSGNPGAMKPAPKAAALRVGSL